MSNPVATERRLAAIFAADIAGYSRLMAADEDGTLEALKAHRREVVDPAIAMHSGRIVKTTGDGMLVEFASAIDAVTCAVAVQTAMAGRKSGSAVDQGMRFASASMSAISSPMTATSSATASTLPRVWKR